ncbi:winged helix-turn-helix domain-containing protein, partial [Sutterella wadsworthensis]
VEVLKKMREKSHIPVLMLTARGDPVDRIVGLELGADDYVQKPCPPRELVARINAILRRSATAWAAAAPVIVGPVTIDPAQRSVNSAAGPIALTGTEFPLFELLARHAGTPVPKEEIYPKVLGRPMGPYDRAIDVHVSAIRHKVSAVIGKKIAIESIRGVGYQLVIHPDA